MMSTTGVHAFLNCLVSSINAILSDTAQTDKVPKVVVQTHLRQGCVINTFTWMSHEWLLSLDEPETTHDVFVLNVDDSPSPINVMMRLEPFIGMANRSVDLFKSLNNALVTLYSLEGRTESQNVMPVCYSFFNKEFARYAEMGTANSEVRSVLNSLCDSLERGTFRPQPDQDTKRLSIIDSRGVKMSGPRTTSTSTKVVNCAHIRRAKMVERFQVDVLDRKAKPTRTNRRHTYSICRNEGHHSQTRTSILDPEHAERASLFLRQLIEKRKAQRYLDMWAKRG